MEINHSGVYLCRARVQSVMAQLRRKNAEETGSATLQQPSGDQALTGQSAGRIALNDHHVGLPSTIGLPWAIPARRIRLGGRGVHELEDTT